MKKRKPQFNPPTVELFRKVAEQCNVKKARAALKFMLKSSDLSMYTSMPGVISNHAPLNAETLNIMYINASDNDIVDHGRWIVLLGYLRNNKKLNINLWIIPKQGVKGSVTKGRPILDYLIDSDYDGTINTNVVAGDFATVLSEIGLDNIDIILNDNPDVDDHNDIESRSALAAAVSHGIPYVISDMSPLVLNFKLHLYNTWGLTASKPMQFNKYALIVKRNISAPMRYMGYSLVIDSNYCTPCSISKPDKQILNSLATSLISCLNIGEPLKRLPSSESLLAKSENVRLLEQFSINQDKKTLTCSHSGDNVTFSFKSLPECPVQVPFENLTNAQQSELTLWIFSLYQLYLHQLNQMQKVAS